MERFVAQLTASGLLSAAEVDAFQESLPPNRRPKDVESLARELVRANKLTKYQAQAVYQGKIKTLAFGEYRVLDKLGQGGMGVVLKAEHRRMKRLVAVKMIAGAALKSPDAVKRFYREVEAAAKLNHPNIVQAYDASDQDGIHYLVMEYVEGKDLGAIVKEQGPLPIDKALDCIVQAARGLEYAHRQGIVHRDIKPSNLLLDQAGTVKILDMGLARIGDPRDQDDKERLTASGELMGTCDYMAPEQAFDTHSADARADIYSLGCTLYRLVTGKSLYEGGTLMQTLLAHREASIPSLRQARSDVPEELDGVFQKMVAKSPQDRHQSMAEVVSAVRGFVVAENEGLTVVGASITSARGAVTSPGRSTPGRAATAAQKRASEKRDDTLRRKTSETGHFLGFAEALLAAPRRKKTLAVGIGLGTLGLLAAILLAITIRVRHPDGKETSVTVPEGSQVAVNPKGDVDVTVNAADAGQPSTSPVAARQSPIPASATGSEEAWPAGPSEDILCGIVARPAKIPGIHRWQVETIHWRNVADWHVLWCSDGRLVTYSGDCLSLRLISPDTLATRQLLLGHRSSPFNVVSSRDGRLLASFAGNWNEACQWTPDGALLRRREIPSIASGTMNADGSQYAVRGWGGAVQILRADLADGPSLNGLNGWLPVWSPDGRWFAAVNSSRTVVLFRSDGTRGPTLEAAIPFRRYEQGHRGLAWTPDSRTLACGRKDGKVSLWKVDGTAGPVLEGHDGDVTLMSWSPDGRWLASGGKDGTILVRGPDGTSRHLLKGHEGPLDDLEWSPDGRYLASACEQENAARLWLGAPQFQQVAKISLSRARDVTWSPDSKQWAVASGYWGGIAIADLQGKSRALPTSPLSVGRIAWDRDGNRLACVVGGGTVRVFRHDGALVKVEANAKWMKWLPDRKRLAVQGQEDARIWNGETVKTEPADKWAFYGGVWRPDGQLVATSKGTTIQLYKGDGTSLTTLQGHTQEVVSLAWRADGQLLASLGRDGELRTWKPDGQAGSHFEVQKQALRVVFRPDGERLAVVGNPRNDQVQLWTLGGRLERSIGIPNLCDFAWSPDGRRLVLSSSGQRRGLTIWKGDGTEERSPLPEALHIRSVAWSTNSRDLAFGTVDGVLRLRDMDADRVKWSAICLRDGESATFSEAGQILDGNPAKLKEQLVYVVERTAGAPQELWTYQQFHDHLAKVGMSGYRSADATGSATQSVISHRSSTAPVRAVAPFDAKQAKEHQESWAKHLGVPLELTNSIGMKLALIPPGEFDMGSSAEELDWVPEYDRRNNSDPRDRERLSSESPRHRVKISKPFRLGMYHVTQADYEKVMGINPSAFTAKQADGTTFQPPLAANQIEERKEDLTPVAGKDTSRHPVETVNWDDAMEFCQRLSAMPAERTANRVYRLPTEAEWEYACRAGTETRWNCGNDEAGVLEVAWFRKNAGEMTHPVGEKAPNAWGLYDTNGNVWQWCADWFDQGYYKQSAERDPGGPPSGTKRVLRGGTWWDPVSQCRSACRASCDPAHRARYRGFRVVVDVAR